MGQLHKKEKELSNTIVIFIHSGYDISASPNFDQTTFRWKKNQW